jgi:5-methylcytosine-specific restriction endonuclease McrA
MKEKILELKTQGKSYNEIAKILKCSKGTIAYHCGDGQKEKTDIRRKKRLENIIIGKTNNFKYSPNVDLTVKPNKNLVEAVRKFQKRDNKVKGLVNKNIETTFVWGDVINKFGINTKCYLSGEPINLYQNDYNFDHIIPTTRGGQNLFSNLGILHETVNMMKGDLTPDELISWCVKILKYNGYKIEK